MGSNRGRLTQVKKNIYSKRISFPKGVQQEFLEEVKKILNLNWNKIAELIGVNKRTLFDWRREKYTIPLLAYKKLCKITGIREKNSLKIKDSFWHLDEAAKKGGRAVWNKYGQIGDPKKRRIKWREWWKKEGKNKLQSYPIYKPKLSNDLAEFVGIMLGDGGMSEGQLCIYLNSKDDKEYAHFVQELVKKLFKIKPSVYKRKDCNVKCILISRKRLIKYCELIGLMIGNKIDNQIDIPRWILKENSYKVACIRGLFDTDGCVYDECHTIKEKKYSYLRMSFVSYSRKLRKSFYEVLEEMGFDPTIRNERSVKLEKKKDVIKYFKEIGTNNPKHKIRYKEILGRVG